MQTDTYDRATEANETKRQSESLLPEVTKGLFFLVCFCALLNLPLLIAPEKIGYWWTVTSIGFQVFLWVTGIFAVIVAYSDKKHKAPGNNG